MVVFVLGSGLLGLIAAVTAILSGMSFVMAILVYAGVGMSTMALVLIRTTICLRLKASEQFSPIQHRAIAKPTR